MKRKTLQELTFKDNFMFAAVMLDEENAKGVIERALEIKVDHVEVSYEKRSTIQSIKVYVLMYTLKMNLADILMLKCRWQLHTYLKDQGIIIVR